MEDWDRASLLNAIHDAANETALENLRINLLGKSGEITQLLKTLGSMSPEERQAKAVTKARKLRERFTHKGDVGDRPFK